MNCLLAQRRLVPIYLSTSGTLFSIPTLRTFSSKTSKGKSKSSDSPEKKAESPADTQKPAPQKIPQRLRRKKSNLTVARQLTKEVKDGQGLAILKPGNAISSNKTQFYRSTASGTYRRTHQLPLLNASALLNTKDYCVSSANSATSKSGTEAARRLLRGKRDFVAHLRQHVLRKAPTRGASPTSFVLQGHGVPVQLLQDHINLADGILTQEHDAAAVSFQQYRDRSDDTRHAYELSSNWIMRVRSKTGTNLANRLAHDGPWAASMELYLAAMNRITTALGVVLQHEIGEIVDEYEDEYENVFTETSQVSSYPPAARHWNVEFLRGLTYPPEWVPPYEPSNSSEVSKDPSPVPMVEWIPLQGALAPGHVTVRVQGFASSPSYDNTRMRRRKPQAVTLCFDACFRNPTLPSSVQS
jgi:hypothetical protein|uniref:Uncharacterized protein n=1 Tax=Phaeodactylum tricornutum TaxID=2850 RepID=A0A8J9TJC0_PHATR